MEFKHGDIDKHGNKVRTKMSTPHTYNDRDWWYGETRKCFFTASRWLLRPRQGCSVEVVLWGDLGNINVVWGHLFKNETISWHTDECDRADRWSMWSSSALPYLLFHNLLEDRKGYGLCLLKGQFLHQDTSKALLSIFFHMSSSPHHFLWICSMTSQYALPHFFCWQT